MSTAPDTGHVIRFISSTTSAAGQCTDPADLAGTSPAGCTPWVDTYGFFFGDGTSSDVEMLVDRVIAAGENSF